MLWRRKEGKRTIYNGKTKVIIASEYQECKGFWEYAVKTGFDDDLVKNANERMNDDHWFIKALYAIGLRKGLLDYHYIVANEKYNGLWIEMKRADQQSQKKKPEQDEWIERLLKRGHYATYAYGWEHAVQIYKDYVNNRL